MSLTWLVRLALAFECALLARSQAIHTVTVGDTGSFYDPPTISALQGDIITFIFSGRSHSVTQSNFSNPCTRLQGGFDSDSYGVTSLSPGQPVPQWNLTVTDDTKTIWFYCKNTLPQSHCTAGMVGAINPPIGSNQTYDSFQAAAKAINTTPVATPGAVLSGVGATASSVPTLMPLPGSYSASTTSSSSSSTSTSSSTSSTSIPTQTATKSSSNAAVIGGAVGGSVGGVVIVAILAFFIFFRKRNATNTPDREAYDPSRKEFFDEEPIPRNGPYAPSTRAMSANVLDYRSSTFSDPNIQRYPSPSVGGHSGGDDYNDSQAQLAGSSTDPRNSVRELAAEIATLMKAETKATLPAVEEREGEAGPLPQKGGRPLPAQPVPQPLTSQNLTAHDDAPPSYTGTKTHDGHVRQA
ncbi:hypothetical protein SISNIDRAFT_468687 [Sistotremastrum niveocremeum HHB9708]|uniref:Cupredoxin n=2 Tax=Sistotremastraceae TaxID=3402574 RepID=A0A164R885_9AGAM|nr:hypothetical protein SISNIDRAFT_468687 [Sistotremastrum niveocremeum HHB9708]KZT42775.1 hypothetical protein SISSUDRAFT_1116766 [Sistotremastrum suecicum HHB10207 ss-3]